MTDELVKRLRSDGTDMRQYEREARTVLYGLRTDAADRIEQLTAERDGLLRCVTDNHMALCRAEAAEAERDRLREALKLVASLMHDEYNPHSVEGMAGAAARAALKGETP